MPFTAATQPAAGRRGHAKPARPLRSTHLAAAVYAIEAAWRHERDSRVQRMGLALALGLHGLRSTETANAAAGDIDTTRWELRVRSAKRGNTRYVPLDPQLALTLIDFWARLGRPRRALFKDATAERSACVTVRDSIAIVHRDVATGYRYHDLRATAATQLYNATNDVLAVMTFLGHKSLLYTVAYLRTAATDVNAATPRWTQSNVYRLRKPVGRPRHTHNSTPPPRLTVFKGGVD